MPEFTEVADRVWVARYEWFDVNVTLVGSDRGLLAVDTHGSAAAAREVIGDVRRLGAGEVTRIVNTHAHFDHTFGNDAFRTAYGEVPIHAHENVAADLVVFAARTKERFADSPDDPHQADVAETRIVIPDHTFSSTATLDLGDRMVELIHPGRGHTSGDLVVQVPDVDVVLTGDLIEESAAPFITDDAWPMEWPQALDNVLSLTNAETVVVPGHGAPVDRGFVQAQRNELAIVAETIRDLATRGVPVDEAVDAADWPFPRPGMAAAVRRGYEHLRCSRRPVTGARPPGHGPGRPGSRS